MTTDHPTCESRVDGSWQSTKLDLEALLNPHEADPEHLEDLGYTDPDDAGLYEYGLGFDYVEAGTFDDQPEGFFRYQFSYGGPRSELRFFVSLDGSLHRAEFWFLDWFDGASLDLTDDDTARAVFEVFDELGMITIPEGE